MLRSWRRTITVLALIVALGAAGAASLRLANARDDRGHTQSLERETASTLASATAQLVRVEADLAARNERNVLTRRERDDLRALAAGLANEIQRTRRSTMDSNVDAFTAGNRANVLARCLAGVSRALNQLSVGDGGALASLQAVAEPCRAARAA